MPFLATFWKKEGPRSWLMVTVEDDVILYKNCIKLTNIQQGPRHKSTTNVVCDGTNHKKQTTFFYTNTKTNIWNVLTKITTNNFFLWKGKDKNVVCASTNHNKQRAKVCWHKSQQTIFFLWKDKDKNVMYAGTNHNKQRIMCVSTNHNKLFFYERTRIKMWCVLAQITINKLQFFL